MAPAGHSRQRFPRARQDTRRPHSSVHPRFGPRNVRRIASHRPRRSVCVGHRLGGDRESRRRRRGRRHCWRRMRVYAQRARARCAAHRSRGAATRGVVGKRRALRVRTDSSFGQPGAVARFAPAVVREAEPAFHSAEEPVDARAMARSFLLEHAPSADAPGAWQRLADAADLQALIRTGPILVVAQDPAALAAKRPTMELFKRHGISVEETDPSSARAIEPMLRPDIAGAFVYPRAQYTIDPASLTRKLVEAFVRTGGVVAGDEVVSVRVLPSDVVAVAGRSGSWTARQAVVAAGIGSRSILRSLGIGVPLAA